MYMSSMAQPIATARTTLVTALEKTEWGVTRLHREAGVTCTRTSLHRKLYGYKKGRRTVYQPITSLEYRKLARALGVLSDDDASTLERMEAMGLRGAA